jgi:hypothetical protein
MKRTKYIHVGKYVAEVDVELLEDNGEEGWGPYLSLEDAYKLDDVREHLKAGELNQTLQLGRVYTLTPVASSGDA